MTKEDVEEIRWYLATAKELKENPLLSEENLQIIFDYCTLKVKERIESLKRELK